jgi:uncharacterized protein (DUF952 family)
MGPELFHLATPAAWAAAQADGELAPPSLAAEGFVHCSTREQLVGTIERHFTGVDELVLLRLDEAAVGGALQWEESRPGETYPHVYRALRLADVVDATIWHRAPDGSVTLPGALG